MRWISRWAGFWMLRHPTSRMAVRVAAAIALLRNVSMPHRELVSDASRLDVAEDQVIEAIQDGRLVERPDHSIAFARRVLLGAVRTGKLPPFEGP